MQKGLQRCFFFLVMLLASTLTFAQQRTVTGVITNEEIAYLDGEVHGEIIKEIRGNDGFGYDPVFVPNGFSETFAEMKAEEKNQISHRFHAVQKLIKFVQTLS